MCMASAQHDVQYVLTVMLPPCLQSQQHIIQLEEQVAASQRQVAELQEEIEQLELSTAYTAYASTQVGTTQHASTEGIDACWHLVDTAP